MVRTFESLLRELLLPRGLLGWIARLLVWTGLMFLLSISVSLGLGQTVVLGWEFIVVSMSSIPVFALIMWALREAEDDLSEMTDAALTDELTGLMNRRAFFAAIEGRRDGAVLVIDIDHFKYVNDRYGHAAGDEVLRAMAGHLRLSLRTGDIIARIGGEEFALFLPGLDSLEIDKIGERISRGFVIYNDKVPTPVKVTMSIGAAYAAMSDDTSTLLRNADQALYQAKRSGRAQLAFWAPQVTARY